MFCSKCGNEIQADAKFCGKCGAVLNNSGQEIKEEKPSEKKKVAPSAVIGIAAGGLAVVVAVIALVFFLASGGNEDGGEQDATSENVVATMGAGSSGDGDASGEETPQTPLYSIPDVAYVDLTAGNHALGAKQSGMTWDKTLFYWLEDVDTSSSEDGYLAHCRVTKTLLRDAQSQKLRQYEIYSDPNSGAIYKIVSIEAVEDGLALVDYYYRDGRPDFIFMRVDTVYTPTYATPSKVGERYYFNSEVMVRWRIIQEPGVIGEYVLTPGEVSYSQEDYYAQSDELRGIYDAVELRMFNAAYNTYDAIAAGGHIGLVQGVLHDTLGNGIADKTVSVYRESDNVLLYEAVTDANGLYSFFVYLDDTSCYLKVEGDASYRETLVQGVQFLQSSVNYSYGLTMHKNSGDEYPVTLHAYSCMDVVSDENGTVCGEPIQTVTATVREGAGNYSGEGIRTVEAQNGELTTSLPSGAYTVQFHAEGYLDNYMEVEVAEEAVNRDAYVMPGLAENQVGVILTWDGDALDLDLTLFTPYQAENGDMAHIGGNVDRDGHGNLLVSDNKSKCEAMFINSDIQGSYKLYVNNYTDSVAGNYTSDGLYGINVHVYIYNNDGFVAEYSMPLGQNGVVWEVVEVNGRNVTPAQRVYSQISGKNWWTGSKEVWNPEDDTALLANLQSADSELRDLMEGLLICSKEEIDSLLRGEQNAIKGLFHDERAGVVERIPWVRENAADYEICDRLNTQYGLFNSYYLTEEQIKYLVYSMCGKSIDIDFSNWTNRVAPYIGIVWTSGEYYRYLDHISIERQDAHTWSVRGYCIESWEFESNVVSRVRFTVVKNPDSCFNGYSLTDFEVEEEAPSDSDWAQIYYNYLTADPEGIGIMQAGYGYSSLFNEHRYGLFYVDDNMTPELYLKGNSYADGDILLSIHNGRVIKTVLSEDGGSYIPYTGLIRDENSHMGGSYGYIYHMENGQVKEIGSWDGYWSNVDEAGNPIDSPLEPDKPMALVIDSCWLNGNEVTPEQYQEAINAYGGAGEFWKFGYGTQYSSILELLFGKIR